MEKRLIIKTLAVYTYTHNCLKIDYPIVESIQSSLTVADKVIICDCFSIDGTHEVLQALARVDSRLEIIQHPWGEFSSIQGRICNLLIDKIKADGFDYALQVQADEIICEWTIAKFRRWLNSDQLHGAPLYRHFCPDYQTTFPFFYKHKTVLTACSAAYKYTNNSDGWAVTIDHTLPPNTPKNINIAPLEIHHVGKVQVGREAAALTKELFFQKMYPKSWGYPDKRIIAQQASGKLDYTKIFDPATYTRYLGLQPAVLIPRIAKVESLK